MPERPNGSVLKTVGRKSRGFESHSLRSQSPGQGLYGDLPWSSSPGRWSEPPARERRRRCLGDGFEYGDDLGAGLHRQGVKELDGRDSPCSVVGATAPRSQNHAWGRCGDREGIRRSTLVSAATVWRGNTPKGRKGLERDRPDCRRSSWAGRNPSPLSECPPCAHPSQFTRRICRNPASVTGFCKNVCGEALGWAPLGLLLPPARLSPLDVGQPAGAEID